MTRYGERREVDVRGNEKGMEEKIGGQEKEKRESTGF